MSGALGFDVGGQSVKALLVSDTGDILARGSAPTGEQTDAQSLAATLAGLRDELLAEASRSRGANLAAGGVPVGVGIAGVQDRSGALRGSPHLPRLIGTRLASVLSETLGTTAVVHNDADCAAMAEGWGGAADGCADYLLITVGTGIGSGLVLGGKLRAGDSGFGCEFGHMMVAFGGRECGCGNRGCLEAYISETAARTHVAESSLALQRRIDARREGHGGGFAQAVFELGESGDAEAESIAVLMVDVLGAAIGSVVNVVDLTTIVIGGGIAPGVLARMARLRESAATTLFARPESTLDIVAASRGPLAGAIGAARLGMLA